MNTTDNRDERNNDPSDFRSESWDKTGKFGGPTGRCTTQKELDAKLAKLAG